MPIRGFGRGARQKNRGGDEVLMMRALLLVPLLAILGCPPSPVCTPNDSRCTENRSVAEFCSADGEWLVLLDCANDIGEDGWVCCPTDRGCTCVPADHCAEVTP